MVLGAIVLWSLSWVLVREPPVSPPLRQADAPSAWVTPDVRAPRVRQCTFESAAAKATVSYFVYTPEAYDREPARRFPVVYWLHGTGGGLGGVPQLARRFDNAIRDGRCPPVIVVFPNGLRASMWCDSQDGRVPMETVVVRELLPHVDATMRTMPTRAGRVIEGFSMGGYGAGRLGFRHSDLFGGLSMLAGGPLDLDLMGPRAVGNRAQREALLRDVYGGDLEYFRAQSPWMLAEQHAAALKQAVAIRVVVGERDNTLALNRAFHERLVALSIPHTWTIVPGVDHNAGALIDAQADAHWAFYRQVFAGAGAVAGPDPLPARAP